MVAFTIFGLLALIPVDKYQKAYLDELHRTKIEPQMHLDATYRYVDAIEDGFEDISKGILDNPPEKYYQQIVINQQNKIQKIKQYVRPRYVRDKDNPQILHPVATK
jgi:hypothetical protein